MSREAEFPTRSVDVAGRTVKYLEQGEGRPIVLLHGDGETARDWQWVMPTLAGAGNRVVALSLPGHGGSSPITSYTPEALAGWVARTLTALEVEEPTVVGNSVGALTMLHLVLDEEYPVGRLVLVDSAGMGHMVNPVLAAEVLPGAGEAAVALALLPGGAKVRTLARVPNLTAQPWRTPRGWWDDQFRWGGDRTHLEASLACKRAILDGLGQTHVVLERLKEVQVPTLVLWGMLDRVVPYTHGQAAVQLLPDGHLTLLPTAGHMPHVEQPAAFSAALLNFLATPPQSPALPTRGLRRAGLLAQLSGTPALETAARASAQTLRGLAGIPTALAQVTKSTTSLSALTREARGLLTPERTRAVTSTLEQASGFLTPERTRTLADALDTSTDLLTPENLAAGHHALHELTTMAERTNELLTSERTYAAGDLVERLTGILTPERTRALAELLGGLVDPQNVEAAGDLVQRVTLLTDQANELTSAESTTNALELLRRLQSLLSPERTSALAALLDQAPKLVETVESGRLPRAEDLQQMGPDIHALVELVDDTNQVVTGIPGAERARKRGTGPHPQHQHGT